MSDLIERAAVIDIIANSTNNLEYYSENQELQDEVLRLPPVELRTGKWTLHKDGSGTCSVCGFTHRYVWDMDNWDRYCRHCGVEMGCI